MACFLKQSLAQTCLKEMDNDKLQQFNYSRSLITNRGTVKRGKIHNLVTYKHNNCTIMNYFLELCVKNLRDRIIGRIAKNYYASLGRET